MGIFSKISSLRPSQGSGSGSGRPTPPSHNDTPAPLPLEADGLYIMVSEQQTTDVLHWGLYLHRGDSADGGIFHVSNISVTGDFFYDYRASSTVVNSKSIRAALKVAVVRPGMMHRALRDRLAQIDLQRWDTREFGPLDCRSWVVGALHVLDMEGYIAIAPGRTVLDIENEAEKLAESSFEAGGIGLVKDSDFSIP